ncbi:MAG: hypothetical protein ACE14P_02495 [Methanotrichaceae archaeon]
MRRFDYNGGQTGAILTLFLITLLAPLAPSVNAFPLHGGNGAVNATIYGIMEYEYGDGIYIDISASDRDTYNVELIDADNKTYSGNNGPYRSTLSESPTRTKYNRYNRDILLFNVPKDIVINRLRIIPGQSEPFLIRWTGVPEASNGNTVLKFYGATFEPNGMRWLQGNWNFDVNLTNKANQTLEYNNSDFAMVDQFGWVYQGGIDDGLKKILPEESLRFNIKIPLVSEISRPVEIIYKGIKLNISAWI